MLILLECPTVPYARDSSEFGLEGRIKGVSKLDRHPRADKTNTTQMLPKRAGHLFLFSNLLVESNVPELHQKVSKLLPRKWKMYSTVVLLLSKSDQFRLLGFSLAGRAVFRHHYKNQGNIPGYYFRSRHTYTLVGLGGLVVSWLVGLAWIDQFRLDTENQRQKCNLLYHYFQNGHSALM